MPLTLDHIAQILEVDGQFPSTEIRELLLDSRKLSSPEHSLFFALKGDRRNGHQFIAELYQQGLRHFVVSDKVIYKNYPGAFFLEVPNTLQALQDLAAWHRRQFDIPVLGITGSNGKTVVKEWLYQCLQEEMQVVRSPRSYNSQIGVPLSVWQIERSHEIGIFEAGISRPGEMKQLQTIIQPSLGILTNIGDAHNEGFESRAQKLQEKLQLFRQVDLLIGRYSDLAEHQKSQPGYPVITWGWKGEGDWTIKKLERKKQSTQILLCPGAIEYRFEIPFTDDASIENAITCFIALHHLGIAVPAIVERMKKLQAVDMRLQLIKGINHCTIINDSYSADINSLSVALDFMQQQAGEGKKTVILSDFLQSSRDAGAPYPAILELVRQHAVHRLIGIGSDISQFLSNYKNGSETPELILFEDTVSFLQQYKSHWFREEIVLIKGARKFGFEQIVAQLEQKVHQTILEIDLNAVAHNVKAYQQLLKPSTRLMAMVKAFAYGSGGEIAGVLQYHKIDYLGVAYADEGVELRKAGIRLPIMVMNPEPAAFEQLLEFNLQPVIFSFPILQQFQAYLEHEGKTGYPVHIELETGMHRLGFSADEWDDLARLLARQQTCMVQSVFSHLAASEDPSEDAFSLVQFERFTRAADLLSTHLSYSFWRHISNTAAIARLPQLQLDMVRLGIGMYGIDSAGKMQDLLMPAATLKSSIAQVKRLEAGETVGYNRRGAVNEGTIIATVRIGYADGFPRRLGHGKGSMLIHGKQAPVVGAVCMDMTMVDVTHIPSVKEGDDVIIFGKDHPIQEMAKNAETIPYEIMTGISQRVKRMYFEM